MPRPPSELAAVVLHLRREAKAASAQATTAAAQAARLNALADTLEQDNPSQNSVQGQLPPLKGAALAAAQFIDATPGRIGDEIAAAVGTTPENFRRVFATKLRAHGYANREGHGYYPPAVREPPRASL